MALADKYTNYAELKRAEREDVDFRIIVRPLASNVAIIAPHGGKIEPGTSEIAAAIAAETHCLYLFEGLKLQGNRDLHITAGRFDEPRCIGLIGDCDFVVAIHGCEGDGERVLLGGLDSELRDTITRTIELAGFETGQHSSPALQGVSPRNVCNKGRRHRGAQLEIQRGLRDQVGGADRTFMQRLADAVQTALDQARVAYNPVP